VLYLCSTHAQAPGCSGLERTHGTIRSRFDRRPTATPMVFVALMLLGAFAWYRNSVELLPLG
jgi:hypothetical protein